MDLSLSKIRKETARLRAGARAAARRPHGGARVHVVEADRKEEAAQRGHRRREFFAHRFYVLPRCGPDGFGSARRLFGISDPGRCREIALFADGPSLEDLPADLFVDPGISAHRRHPGRVGHVASANLAFGSETAYATHLTSDLVERVSVRPEHTSAVENRFRGWSGMLLNAVAGAAAARGARVLRIPTAEVALGLTDRRRDAPRERFERVYDRTVQRIFPDAQAPGGWWRIDLSAYGDRIVRAETRTEARARERTVCISHDTERGLGSRGSDPALAREADAEGARRLDGMLDHEARADLRTTYNVVGLLWDETAPAVRAGGHALAFHSYDHAIDGAARSKIGRAFRRVNPFAAERFGPQLDRCRGLDATVSGYRPPQSLLTWEISPRTLCDRNFEWVASSDSSLGTDRPVVAGGVVWIPVCIGDGRLHRDGIGYSEWLDQLVEAVTQRDLTVIGLHDCYAHLWLDRYAEILAALRDAATIRTLDEVSADVILASAE